MVWSSSPASGIFSSKQREKNHIRKMVVLAVCIRLVLAATIAVEFAQVSASSPDFSKHLPSPQCDSVGIWCRNATSLGHNQISLSPDSFQLQLENSVGYVFFDRPIKMVDRESQQVASFNTRFTFNMTPQDNGVPGDGLSFIMFGDGSYTGVPGRMMGVYNISGGQGTPTFSIEFDTFRNPDNLDQSIRYNDTSSSHVGVDLGNITSKITRNTTEVGIQLNDGEEKTAWIEYDALTEQLEIRISNESVRPSDPFISYNVDLSTVLVEEMSVGFAASAGGNVQYHNLVNWDFRSFGLPYKRSLLVRNLVIGLSTGAGVLLFLVVSYIWWMVRKRQRERILDRDFEAQLPLEDMPLRFTYKQLSVATNGFSKNSQLGVGGSSSVYKGMIQSSGTPVAVKKVNMVKNRSEGEKLFVSEISVISRLRHRNLVKLLGWCRDRGNYLLVYELMPNVSLDKFLYEIFNDDGSSLLAWAQRSAIIRGVAAALAYLHEGYAQQVIHRDIKSSNVMLDEEFNPKVGDFGLARLIDHSKNLETMHVAGTLGYIAPEAIYKGVTNEKTDVYAFGTLALEIACGRAPIANGVLPEETVLVDWVWKCYGDGDILQTADSRLQAASIEDARSSGRDVTMENDMAMVQLIGLLCCHPNPDDRPSMREVELFLEGRIPLPPIPRTKPALRFYDTETDIAQQKFNEVIDLAENNHSTR